MEYAAIILALFGAVLGLFFRFRVLLFFVVALLLLASFAAVDRRLGWVDGIILIAAAQAILQCSYFVGLAVRATFQTAQRRLAVPKKPRPHTRPIAPN